MKILKLDPIYESNLSLGQLVSIENVTLNKNERAIKIFVNLRSMSDWNFSGSCVCFVPDLDFNSVSKAFFNQK